jgi:hypothetical protein
LAPFWPRESRSELMKIGRQSALVLVTRHIRFRRIRGPGVASSFPGKGSPSRATTR